MGQFVTIYSSFHFEVIPFLFHLFSETFFCCSFFSAVFLSIPFLPQNLFFPLPLSYSDNFSSRKLLDHQLRAWSLASLAIIYLCHVPMWKNWCSGKRERKMKKWKTTFHPKEIHPFHYFQQQGAKRFLKIAESENFKIFTKNKQHILRFLFFLTSTISEI